MEIDGALGGQRGKCSSRSPRGFPSTSAAITARTSPLTREERRLACGARLHPAAAEPAAEAPARAGRGFGGGTGSGARTGAADRPLEGVARRRPLRLAPACGRSRSCCSRRRRNEHDPDERPEVVHGGELLAAAGDRRRVRVGRGFRRGSDRRAHLGIGLHVLQAVVVHDAEVAAAERFRDRLRDRSPPPRRPWRAWPASAPSALARPRAPRTAAPRPSPARCGGRPRPDSSAARRRCSCRRRRRRCRSRRSRTPYPRRGPSPAPSC